MLRRAAALPIAILAAIALIATPAHATTAPVSIGDSAFAPAAITVQQGAAVKWTNNGQFVHTSTSLQGFWDSGNLAPGQASTQTFQNAGNFSYECTIHHFRGVVKVPLKKTGTAAHGYTLRWSSAASPPAKRKFDVQVKRPGARAFVSFRSATTSLKAFVNPAKAGTYKFRARTRNTANGMTSGWSPVLSLPIS
jgi:plastocyanin